MPANPESHDRKNETSTSSRDGTGTRHLLMLGLVVSLLWLQRFNGPIDLRFDGGVYYVLGTSLAEGRGYRLLNEPGDIEAIQYPPLLPLIVAGTELMVGDSDPLRVGKYLRLLYLLIAAGHAAASYALCRRFLSARFALLAALMCTIHVHTFFHSNLLFAELPFAFVTTACLWLHFRLKGWRRFVAETPLLWAGFLLRTAGVALLLSWIAEAVLLRQWKAAALRLVVAALPVVLWQMFVSEVRSSEGYLKPAYSFQRAPYQYYNVSYAENMLLKDPFTPESGKATIRDLLDRVPDNITVFPKSLSEGITAAPGYWELTPDWPRNWRRFVQIPREIGKVLMKSFLVLIMLGSVILLQRRSFLVPVYFFATLSMLSLTPWPQQFARYLSTVTPLLCLCFCTSIATLLTLLSKLPLWPLRAAAQGAALLLGLTPLWIEAYSASEIYRTHLSTAYHYDKDGEEIHSELFYHSKEWRAFDRAVEWLKTEARPEAMVATSSPHLVHLKTGLRAIFPPFEPDPSKADDLLRSVPVDYVIVDALDFVDVSRRYAAPAVLLHLGPSGSSPMPSPLWREVYAEPELKTWIYKSVREW